MMDELMDEVVEALMGDVVLSEYDTGIWCRGRMIHGDLCAIDKNYSIEVLSLGFSQTAGEGTLRPYFYFAIVVRGKMPFGRTDSNAGKSIDGASERIVELLHQHIHGGLKVFFSKAVRLYEKHTIELNTRRLTLDVPEGEVLEGIFFYASPSANSDSTNPGRLGAADGDIVMEVPEESTGASANDPMVIYVRGDAIWD